MNGFIYVLGLLIALVTVAGALFLMARQKVVVDEQGNVTEVDLPFFGKLRTNTPALAAVVVGLALTAFIIERVPFQFQFEKVPLSAKIRLDGAQNESIVFVGAIPQRYLQTTSALGPERAAEIRFDVDSPDVYTVVAFTIRDLDVNNRPIYSVVQGPTKVIAEPRGLAFDGALSFN